MKNKKERILIIANGEPPAEDLLKRLVTRADFVIAVDGGSNLCRQHQIIPDVIIGDFDSIDRATLTYFTQATIVHEPNQDTHDLYKALRYAQKRSPAQISIVAAFGKRLDHTLANLLLLQIEQINSDIIFYEDHGELTVVHKSKQLNLPPGTTISLFSFLPVSGVSLSGFEFPLQNADFPNGFNGLSNVTETETATISITKGFLFLYRTYENH